MWVWVLLVIVVLIVVYGYNRIVQLEMKAEQAWADIDVQLRRIADLVPNLINVLKGSARFEKGTLESIAEAHTKLVDAMRKGNAEQRVKTASEFMGVFMPIVYQIPQYPDLKTTETFKETLMEITHSVDKIAYARQFYNQAVTEYNTFISMIPWNIIAKLMGKDKKPLFEVPEREEITRRLESGELTKGISEAV